MSYANTSLPLPEQCDMWIKTLQGSVIRTLFETLKDVIFETTLVVSQPGVKATSMDSSKSSLVYLKLNADAFEEFHCEKETSLGISMQSMYKLIKTTGNHDILTMFVLKDVPHELGLCIENSERKSKTIFYLKLLDIAHRDITVPNFSYESIVTIPSANFQRLTRDMQNISSMVMLESHPDKLVLSCQGDFANQTTILGDHEQDESSTVRFQSNTSDIICSTYSLKYLTLFGRSSSLSSVVTLYIKKDHPLVLEFSVGSLGSLKYLLTPQVDDE